MIKKIKTGLIQLSILLGLVIPFAMAPSAYAEPNKAAGDQATAGVCQGAGTLQLPVPGSTDPNKEGVRTTCGISDNASDFDSILAKIINIFSVIVGVLAVIMIIVGGFRYITSGGKEEGVKSAKNSILYALIGLVIVALAQVIVRFVLNKATTA